MRYGEIKLVEDIINEINMSTYSLTNAIKKIENIKVGIEYEFVYNSNESYESTTEDAPDDTHVNSIMRVIDFFSNEDENDGVLDELKDKLKEEYDDWIIEGFDHYVKTEPDDVEKYIKDYYYSLIENEQKIIDNLRDKFKDDDHLIQTAMKWNTARSENNKMFFQLPNSEILKKIKENNPHWSNSNMLQAYYDARVNVYDNLDKKVKEDIDEEDFSKPSWKHVLARAKRMVLTEREFLDETYSRTMSNIFYAYNDTLSDRLYWPMEDIDVDNTVAMDSILDEFNSYVSPNYEISEDSSIRTDSEYDVAVEIKNIDEGLPIAQALDDFKKARQFILDNGYTNGSTGLHINMSLEGFSLEKLDYIKLILLLGDEYLLKKFKRESNAYAMASLERIDNYGSDNESKIAALETLQHNLNSLAGQLIQQGTTQKYTSINVHDNRVEFRGPGGDWVNDQTYDFLKNMIMRMAVALDAAIDPTKYQQEYAKKLYKYIKPVNDYNDVIKIFSLLKSKEMPMAAAKSWLEKIARDSRPVTKISERYWLFGAKDMSYIWGVGKTKSEALEDSRPDILDFIKDQENQTAAWNAETLACAYFPTDKETYDKVMETGSTYRFKKEYSTGLYVIA